MLSLQFSMPQINSIEVKNYACISEVTFFLPSFPVAIKSYGKEFAPFRVNSMLKSYSHLENQS